MKLGISKKKMNKEAIEQVINKSHLRRANFGIKCSRCHKDGHNKATCKWPTTSTHPTSTVVAIEPSPTVDTQPTSTIGATHPTPTAAFSQIITACCFKSPNTHWRFNSTTTQKEKETSKRPKTCS